MLMFLIRFVFFLPSQLPFVEIYFREEGVSIVERVVNTGEIEYFCQGEGCTVELPASYYENSIFIVATRQCLLQRPDHNTAGIVLFFIGSDDYIGAVGKCPFGQRFIGLSSHDDGVPGGKLLKMLQVVWQVAKELPFAPDSVLLIECDDDGDLWGIVVHLHMLTSPFICG